MSESDVVCITHLVGKRSLASMPASPHFFRFENKVGMDNSLCYNN